MPSLLFGNNVAQLGEIPVFKGSYSCKVPAGNFSIFGAFFRGFSQLGLFLFMKLFLEGGEKILPAGINLIVRALLEKDMPSWDRSLRLFS